MITPLVQPAASQEAAVQPPRVVSLPELAVPAEDTIPEGGTVEAVIVVQVSGSGRKRARR
jgi:hypothetical protein